MTVSLTAAAGVEYLDFTGKASELPKKKGRPSVPSCTRTRQAFQIASIRCVTPIDVPAEHPDFVTVPVMAARNCQPHA